MKYETIISENLNGSETTTIIATDDEGKVYYIPTDPANSDYQRYLNPDKVEHLTDGVK